MTSHQNSLKRSLFYNWSLNVTDNESDDDIEEIRAVQAKEAIEAVKTLRQYCENQNDGYSSQGRWTNWMTL